MTLSKKGCGCPRYYAPLMDYCDLHYEERKREVTIAQVELGIELCQKRLDDLQKELEELENAPSPTD